MILITFAQGKYDRLASIPVSFCEDKDGKDHTARNARNAWRIFGRCPEKITKKT
jgi:hypothetical protein